MSTDPTAAIAPTPGAPDQLHAIPPKSNRPSLQHLVDTIRMVMRDSGHAIEIRAPRFRFVPDEPSRTRNVVHRFPADQVEAAAAVAYNISGLAPAIYLVMNGVSADLPTGLDLRVGCKGKEIPRRLNLLIDIDPTRPGDVSSTVEEKAEARQVMETIRDHLKAEGWPEPIVADSGNGWHLIYAIDLPNDDSYEETTSETIDQHGNPKTKTTVRTIEGGSTSLIRRCLRALAEKFDTAGAKVDRVVFDNPRLIKLHGTLSAKGRHQSEEGRPWRYSNIRTHPDPVEVVAPELLEALADSIHMDPGTPAGGDDLRDQDSRESYRSTGQHHAGGTDVESRAVAYMARIEPSVSGQKGHNKTFGAVCRIGPGFDLSEEATFRIIKQHYNPRCQPPWTDGELAHKVQDAFIREVRRGWLLNAPRKDAPPPKKPSASVDPSKVHKRVDDHIAGGDPMSILRDDKLMGVLAALAADGSVEVSHVRLKIKAARKAGFLLGDFNDCLKERVDELKRRLKAEKKKGKSRHVPPPRASPGPAPPGAVSTGPGANPEACGPPDDDKEAWARMGQAWSDEDDARRQSAGGKTGRERPQVLISTEEFAVNNEVVGHLAAAPKLFVRGPFLVRVGHEAAPKREKIKRPEGTPHICRVTAAGLRELTTEFVEWTKWGKDDEGNPVEVPTHPPRWSIDAILERGEWALRTIDGITEAPVLRPDGTILDTPGYDETTGLYYEPNEDFPPFIDEPTFQDVKDAVATLYDPIQDFPYAEIRTRGGLPLAEGEDPDGPDVESDDGQTHRAAFLAAALTPLARPAIDGPTPIFRFDASVAGVGKSKQCDIISIISTGQEMARTQFPDKIEEQEKQFGAIALAGDSMILFDNVKNGGAFGGPMLDMAATGTRIKVRILGRSEMPIMPWTTVIFASGNNLSAAGDGLRRMLPIRLETDDAHPETRTGFKIEGDLLAHVKEIRPKLVHAALTILRGYAVAGRPKPPRALPRMDFPSWCDQIRDAVYWATGFDPCATRAEMIAGDDESNDQKALIEGFAELPGSQSGLTCAEALRLVELTPSNFEKLRDAMAEWSAVREMPTAKSLGKRLKAIKNRNIGNKMITATTYQGTQRWKVTAIKSGGSCGSGGSSPGHATNEGEKENISPRGNSSFSGCSRDSGTGNSHNSHNSHQPNPPSPTIDPTFKTAPGRMGGRL
jgi:hypothetical protein